MNLKILEPLENENTQSYIYRNLKYNIMSLTLIPGEKISEGILQNIFNTSKSPIREALIKLKEEKLIEITPQKGTFISKINLKFVENTVFIRRTIEKEVLKLVISSEKNHDELIVELERILESIKKLIVSCNCNDRLLNLFNEDKKFHETIFNFVDKKDIWDIITNSSSHYERFRVLETPESDNLSFIIEQHKRIITLIKNKDLKLLDISMNLHGKNFSNSFHKLFIKYSSYFMK